MQLDNTRIAIRERNLLDIFDLSLHVMRDYAGPLLLTFLLGAVPLTLINDLLLGWILKVESDDAFFYLEEQPAIWRYWWDMTLLVLIEAPLASIFTTFYLGQAVFVERPDLRYVVGEVGKMLPRVAWCQVLVRGILPAWLLLLLVERYEGFNWGIEFVLLGGIAASVSVLRALRPFVNEIVLLERNPLTSRDPSAITVGRRSAQLHGPSAGDLFSRWLAAAGISVLLTVAVLGTLVFLSGVLFNHWQPGPTALRVLYPTALWIVAWYLSVVRFLNYLDLRIRHEGWEVELRLRAEAVRQAAKLI